MSRHDGQRRVRRTDGNQEPVTGPKGLLGAILDRAIRDAQGYKIKGDSGNAVQIEAIAWLTDSTPGAPDHWTCRWILEQLHWPEYYRRRILAIVLQSKRGVLGKRRRLS